MHLQYRVLFTREIPAYLVSSGSHLNSYDWNIVLESRYHTVLNKEDNLLEIVGSASCYQFRLHVFPVGERFCLQGLHSFVRSRTVVRICLKYFLYGLDEAKS